MLTRESRINRKYSSCRHGPAKRSFWARLKTSALPGCGAATKLTGCTAESEKRTVPIFRKSGEKRTVPFSRRSGSARGCGAANSPAARQRAKRGQSQIFAKAAKKKDSPLFAAQWIRTRLRSRNPTHRLHGRERKEDSPNFAQKRRKKDSPLF